MNVSWSHFTFYKSLPLKLSCEKPVRRTRIIATLEKRSAKAQKLHREGRTQPVLALGCGSELVTERLTMCVNISPVCNEGTT